jgi:hypothetical protein
MSSGALMYYRSDSALVAVAGTYRNAFAAFGAAAGKNRSPRLGFHTRQKAVRLRSMAAVRLECALGHNAALLISLKNICFRRFHNYCGLIKIARYGFPWEETTNTFFATVYINFRTPLGQASSIPDSRQSAKYATNRNPGIATFHYAWCNSAKKEMFARNEQLHGLATVLVSAPIKNHFLHVNTT